MTGCVVWITGLSASGKTTLGNAVTSAIRNEYKNMVSLDGDILRSVFEQPSSFNREERLHLAFVYSRLCKMLLEQGLIVVIATVALFKEVHAWNRENFDHYIEVFLDVPISELRRRDPKGLYRKYDSGELRDVAGLDLIVDFPSNPHFHFVFEKELNVQNMTNDIFKLLKSELSGDLR
jgi:adenylylsulfate kinase-like enzyme